MNEKIYSYLIMLGGLLYLLEPLLIVIIFNFPIYYAYLYYTLLPIYILILPLLIIISGTLTMINRLFIRRFGSIMSIAIAFTLIFISPIGLGYIPTIIGATQKL